MKPLFDRVVIIGVGLIGGSLGMALCSRGLAGWVTGVDLSEADLRLAVETEAIHDWVKDPEKAVRDADLVVVATPVGLTADIIKRVIPFIKKGCVITDVGSTKAMIVREAETLMPPGTYFVGGHPMTGSEMAGVKGADRYLFENAVYVLTPTGQTDPGSLAKIRQMADNLGSNVIELNPEEHDLMVAAVSHLPHLVAATLVNTVGTIQRDHPGLLLLAAGGFRDTTRVASGHPVMWRDICLSNKESILKVLDKFGEVLGRTREMVEQCDEGGLLEGFEQARELRRNIPARMKGYLPVPYEIVATVPDKPGVIANLAGILGDNNININDIEIMRVREGEGGTIKIAFANPEDQETAVNVFKINGINVKKR